MAMILLAAAAALLHRLVDLRSDLTTTPRSVSEARAPVSQCVVMNVRNWLHGVLAQ